jgi:hypothetical protein
MPGGQSSWAHSPKEVLERNDLPTLDGKVKRQTQLRIIKVVSE